MRRKPRPPFYAAALLLGLLGSLAGAEPELPDKSRYDLFHPTSPDLSRAISLDHLDQAESDARWQGPFDFGRNFGMTDAAPDFNPFVGLTMHYWTTFS